jgi:dTDP-4-amino-4,6-dideoxygalactose transaminase
LALPHFQDPLYFDIYQNYVIRTQMRDELRKHLKDQGVETLVHWPKPMWEHKDLGLENPGLPETESICSEVISLPMSAETTPEHVAITVGCIRDFLASRRTALRIAVAD